MYEFAPIRLYAEAFWFTLAANDSGRGGTGGIPDEVLDELVVEEGAVNAFDPSGADAPVAVAVGGGMVAGRIVSRVEIQTEMEQS